MLTLGFCGWARVAYLFNFLSCTFLFCFVFVLCLVFTMFPVSLDCTFLMVPSVSSNIYIKGIG